MPREYARREILIKLMEFPCSALLLSVCGLQEAEANAEGADEAIKKSLYGMGIQVDKCIGCGSCVAACKAENDVPEEPFYFRTWVERYVIHDDGRVDVDSPEGGIHGFTHDRRTEPVSCAPSSSPNSAINATTLPAYRSARSGPHSRLKMALSL